jgi:hypothetical protein
MEQLCDLKNNIIASSDGFEPDREMWSAQVQSREPKLLSINAY